MSRAEDVPPAVSVRGLEKRYGRLAALDGVSFDLEPGSFTLAAGPNGAGKSTLLRILGSLTRPTRGEVRIFDADPFGANGPDVRARIGYLGSAPGMYDEMTVEENLRFAAGVRGLARRRVADILGELDLEAMAGRRVRTLSLGYRRRAGLARALLGSPELLLLDEPWNGLDAAAARGLTDFLLQQLQAGTTLIIASHAVREHLDLFGAVLLLDAGRLDTLEPPHAGHLERL